MRTGTRLLLTALTVLFLTGCGGSAGTASSSGANTPERTDMSEVRDMPEKHTEPETLALPELSQEETLAVYLGVEGYGSEKVSKETEEDFRYRFFADGGEVTYAVDNGERTERGYAYDIQNHLKEGSLYALTLKRETVTRAEELVDGTAAEHGVIIGAVEALDDDSITVDGAEISMGEDTGVWEIHPRAGGTEVEKTALQKGKTVCVGIRKGTAAAIYVTRSVQPYTPPVSGAPGERTLKNLLATAFMPVGTTLYIYGGGWDWQDISSSVQATSIGVSRDWVSFFQRQDEDYTYKNADPAHSYYPFHEWNEYYYAGLDCSGYLGWTLYNTMHTEDGGKGYVGKSTSFAKHLSDLDWGEWSRDVQVSTLRPGDIVSISGHVWLSLGACSDGSALILHSTPSDSRSGQPGGGPQLSALGDSRDCEAYRLAERCLSDYYPAWYERYPVKLCDPDAYCSLSAEEAGKFTWALTGDHDGLTDPDGYRQMSPEEILQDLFAGAEQPS